jgi:hypothetical protein
VTRRSARHAGAVDVTELHLEDHQRLLRQAALRVDLSMSFIPAEGHGLHEVKDHRQGCAEADMRVGLVGTKSRS